MEFGNITPIKSKSSKNLNDDEEKEFIKNSFLKNNGQISHPATPFTPFTKYCQKLPNLPHFSISPINQQTPDLFNFRTPIKNQEFSDFSPFIPNNQLSEKKEIDIPSFEKIEIINKNESKFINENEKEDDTKNETILKISLKNKSNEKIKTNKKEGNYKIIEELNLENDKLNTQKKPKKKEKKIKKSKKDIEKEKEKDKLEDSLNISKSIGKINSITETNLENSLISEKKDDKKKICCNCKKSQCLKLYCDCYALKEFCTGDCKCLNCANIPENEDQRNVAMLSLIERNKDAFKDKFEYNKKGEIIERNPLKHTKGCNCKRSNCLKQYCECYKKGIKCCDSCKCDQCKNIEIIDINEPSTKKKIHKIEDEFNGKISAKKVKLHMGKNNLMNLEDNTKI